MTSNPPTFEDVFPNFHAWQQLAAVRGVLDAVFTYRNKLHEYTADAEQELENARGTESEMAAEANAINLYEERTYTDAAADQAAVGAIAPFLEGFFVHVFAYLGQLHGAQSAPTQHTRWSQSVDRFWNPREAKSGGIAAGIRELRDALDLGVWISDGALKQIELLFAFRNRSMHFAFEWTPEELAKFRKFVDERGFAGQVEWATSGGIDWMATLKDSFLKDIAQTTMDIVHGFPDVAKARGGHFQPVHWTMLGSNSGPQSLDC